MCINRLHTLEVVKLYSVHGYITIFQWSTSKPMLMHQGEDQPKQSMIIRKYLLHTKKVMTTYQKV